MADRRDLSEKIVSQETRLQQVEDFLDSLKGFAVTLLSWFGGICVVTCGGLAFVLNLYLTPINIQLKALTEEMREQRINAKTQITRDSKQDQRISKVEVEVENLKERVK